VLLKAFPARQRGIGDLTLSYELREIKNLVDKEHDFAYSDTNGLYLPRAITNSWRMIPPTHSDDKTLRVIHRLNALGSLYYHATVVLGKHKFQKNPNRDQNLHYQMCHVVEKDGLKEVIEIPRDHFKSTVYSECYPSWRALPFTNQDEDYMRSFGYGDRWIQWMRYVHRQDIRILLVSEVINNAKKLGVRLQAHYSDNALFRYLFPEILPDSSCTQNDESFHQMRSKTGKQQGEGTFDFIGVGSALQSRHYDAIVQDDLVGRAAFESDTTMQKTIEYHQLLVGAFDAAIDDGGRDNDEIVVGNRWSYKDLNSYIRSNEQYFNFTTHSALGGCCGLHPIGVPIFPEAFNIEKLARYKKRLGSYLFSCQYLNVPINPAEVKFDKKNLRYYEFVKDPSYTYTDTSLFNKSGTRTRTKVTIHHKVREGDVEEDIAPRNLKRYLIADPNHSGNEGRCRNAITVTGVSENPSRIYLLDVWAKSSSMEEFIETMLHLAVEVWKLDAIHLETIAAQKVLKYHMEYIIKERARDDPRYAALRIVELKTPKTANAKKMRIDGLGPIFERGEFWINSFGMEEFHEEFETYPNGKLVDVLDTLGYGPTIWDFDTNTEDIEREILVRKNQYKRNIRNTVMGYQ
jgi:hypothetical protein